MTEPLATDTVLAGTGSVDLWVRSSKPDVDLEVTISEVRPDGEETYVQSGWLRASQRALDAGDVDRPAPGADPHRAPTWRRCRPTTPRCVRVPLYPFAHAFRAGSRIRIVVQPPGGNRPVVGVRRAAGAAHGDGVALRRRSRRRWCSPWCRASTSRRRCPRAARCGANRAAPTNPSRTGARIMSHELPRLRPRRPLRRAVRRARSARRRPVRASAATTTR